MRYSRLFAILALLVHSAAVWAHPGGQNNDGCHTNKKTGEYHCHGAGVTSRPSKEREPPLDPTASTTDRSETKQRALPPGCYVGPRGGTYTLTKSGKKNYGGC
ncbi:MAG: YHYH domain-containing protein [Methylibium sp.]|nr:YHYH domain-containing protein [Methylibium sp.]